MVDKVDVDRFPEWRPFTDAVENRSPETGTWCEAWTVRDIVAHQAGNAEELARVLAAHLAGNPVATRSFEERETPYRAMNNTDLWQPCPLGWSSSARSLRMATPFPPIPTWRGPDGR